MKTVAVYTDYSNLSDETADILKKLLSEHIDDKCDKLKKGSLCVRVMLKVLLKRYFDVEKFTIFTDENGKPYINVRDVHFNFSHSDGKSLCVVSTQRVGCDVQSMKPFNSKVSSRYYRREEDKMLIKSENTDEDFIKLWTLKEAILKQKGLGLSGGLASYGFSEYLHNDSFEAYGLKFRCFKEENFYYAICSETDDFTVSEIDIEELIKNLM